MPERLSFFSARKLMKSAEISLRVSLTLRSQLRGCLPPPVPPWPFDPLVYGGKLQGLCEAWTGSIKVHSYNIKFLFSILCPRLIAHSLLEAATAVVGANFNLRKLLAAETVCFSVSPLFVAFSGGGGDHSARNQCPNIKVTFDSC